MMDSKHRRVDWMTDAHISELGRFAYEHFPSVNAHIRISATVICPLILVS